MKKIEKNTIQKNIYFTIFAQLCYLIFSIIMSLIIPKIIGIKSFSYWQLFIFYSSYVGFAHLGITDGMYLKLGGKKIKDINSNEISTLFWNVIFIQLIICFIISILSFIFLRNIKSNILLLTCIYMLFANATWFMEFVFQATNNIKEYSYLTIMSRMFFIIFLALDLYFKILNFYFFIIIFVISQSIASIYGFIKLRKFLNKIPKINKKNILFTFNYSIIGIKLTFSNTVSTLILGIGQFFSERFWGITEFGKMSFAFSITTFLLQFLSQFSLVFFPALRRVSKKEKSDFFNSSTKILNLFLPLIILTYVPINIILNYWLPQYRSSLYWLFFLLPICLFDGKMNILFNNFFKVDRKENILLKYNIISMTSSIIIIILSVILFKNIILIPISITISIFIRSFLSERYFLKFYGNKTFSFNTILQLFYCILCTLLLFLHNNLILFLGSFFLYFIFCFNKKSFFKYVIKKEIC